jgi:hypothetical protein
LEDTEGERTFSRPRYRWEDNVKIDLQEISEKCTAFIWLTIGTNGVFFLNL